MTIHLIKYAKGIWTKFKCFSFSPFPLCFFSSVCLFLCSCVCVYAFDPLYSLSWKRSRIVILCPRFLWGKLKWERQCSFLVFFCHVNRDLKWQYKTNPSMWCYRRSWCKERLKQTHHRAFISSIEGQPRQTKSAVADRSKVLRLEKIDGKRTSYAI